MSLIQKMIKNKGLSEEDTKALIAQLLEFVHLVKCMRKAQIEKDEYDMGERKDFFICVLERKDRLEVECDKFLEQL